ncbi:MAG: response regulator [Lachnospiraceae bacterium]|nr:response regulator [Lachnospiraceae bacterium]
MEDKKATILIVDDAIINIGMLEDILTDLGYDTISASSAAEATNLLMEKFPDLVLLDIMMPDINGYEFCQMLKENPHTRDIPVIFVSAAESDDEMEKAFEIGGVDFIKKPFNPTEIKTRVSTHLNIHMLKNELQESNRKLNRVISEQSKKIDEEKRRILKNIVALNYTDGDGKRRGKIVSANSRMLAQALNFTEKYENKISSSFVDGIEIAGVIREIDYSIFKIFFAEDEKNTVVAAASDVVKSFREKWDGSGHPEGLKGEEIPLAARIVCITDNFDYLMSQGNSREKCLELMKEEREKTFDPYLLDLFFRIEKQMKSWNRK